MTARRALTAGAALLVAVIATGCESSTPGSTPGSSSTTASTEPTRSSTPTQPAPALIPAGILVGSAGGGGPLSVLDPADFTTTQLASSAFDGAVSPGGDRLAVAVVDDDAARLVVTEPDGTTVAIPVTWIPSQLRWSPDGSTLLFSSLEPVGDSGALSRLWVLDPATPEPRQLAGPPDPWKGPADPWDGSWPPDWQTVPWDDQVFMAWNGSWSPDGRSLVWEADGSGGRWAMIGDLRGDAAPIGDLATSGAPAWSPTGDHVAFAGSDEADRWSRHGIYIADARGSNVRALTAQAWSGLTLSWSPVGDRIAFFGSPRNEGTSLYVADVESGEVVPLVDGAGFGPPIWSPDGTRLAFTNHDLEVSIVAVDGGDTVATGVAGTPIGWR